LEKALGLDHYFFFDNMARVNEDTDWVDTTFRPDIKRQHFSQDAYFYRDRVNRLRPNSRAPSDYQKKIQNALEITNEIWNKKPPCWRDHFYRSTLKSKIEGTEPDTKYRELSGYHLYVSKQMEALRNLDGNYYNPVCFCIQPVDMVGWRMPTYGRFVFENKAGLNYLYDETKKLLQFDACNYLRRDPFRSAAFYYDYLLKSGFMELPFTYKRVVEDVRGDQDFYDFKDLPMWFPLKLVLVEGLGPSEINFWDCCYWQWNQVSVCDCTRSGEPIHCIDGFFLPPQYQESLCYKDTFGISIKYSSEDFQLMLSGTDTGPFYDVYWRETKIGRVGVGYGDFQDVAVGEMGGIPPFDYTDEINFGDHLDPCPIGQSECHKAKGDHVVPEFDYADYFDACPELGGYRAIDYYYDLPVAVQCQTGNDSPEIRLKTTMPVYDDIAGFNPAPWGSAKLRFILDNGDQYPATPFARDITFSPGKTEYCYNNIMCPGLAVGFVVHVSTAVIGSACTRTFLESADLLVKT